MRLPIVKLEDQQNMDLHLDSIVTLNHGMEFEPTWFRCDGNLFTYKELTQLDQVEYNEGVNPTLDYMPDEYVAPVLIKINGVTHRASVLTWFPLTDCADAIKLKQYETNQRTYPIFIEKGANPIPAIMNATGYKYHERLPHTIQNIKITKSSD